MIRTRVLFVCGNGLQALNKIRNVVRAAGREDACQNHAKPWDSKRYAQCIVNIRTRRHAQRAADNQRCQLRGGGLAVTAAFPMLFPSSTSPSTVMAITIDSAIILIKISLFCHILR